MSKAIWESPLPSWVVEELNRRWGMEGMPRMVQEFYADRGELIKSVDAVSKVRTITVTLPIGRVDTWKFRRNGTLVREVD